MAMKTFATLAFFTLFALIPLTLSAQSLSGGGTRPFGGRILGSPIYCTCSTGHVVNIGPPRDGRFHFVPGSSRLYRFSNVYTPGRWLLGNYRPGTGNMCLIRVSHNSCWQVQNEGIMTIVGTS